MAKSFENYINEGLGFQIMIQIQFAQERYSEIRLRMIHIVTVMLSARKKNMSYLSLPLTGHQINTW